MTAWRCSRALQACLILALAGCGASVTKPISAARARILAYAHAVNLRPADARKLSPTSAEGELHDASAERALHDCLGLQRKSGEVVRVASPYLIANRAGAVSLVSARPQASSPATYAAEAARYLASLASRRGLLCQERYFRGEEEREGGHRVHVVAMRNPLRFEHGATFRFAVTGAPANQAAPSAAGEQPVYIDVALFYPGAHAVELQTFASPHPFPLATERRLLSLLYARASAHS
jgi:hypothetical protein